MKTEVLGYHKYGSTIEPAKAGLTYNKIPIVCTKCGLVIRKVGGPAKGATCVGCYGKTND